MSKKKKKQRKGTNQFLFRQADSIGTVDAADDDFLAECFIDTGAYEALKDLDKPQRLIVGRTGSGKTALLSYLEKQHPEHVIIVQAESLALAHLSNSTILKFLREMGVKIDLFFKLLWRHILTVEILKRRFNVEEGSKKNFLGKLKSLLQSRDSKKALEYLESWGGEEFWEKTEIRIKELTKKLEKDVTESVSPEISTKIFSLKGGIHVAEKFSSEEKAEIINRAQNVVNNVQIRELSKVIDLVDEALNDGDYYYYVLIDRLDENWVEEDIRYHLIRALLETSKDFQRVRRCKIVVSLRQDLLDRVFETTRDAGFQEEKMRSNILEIRWTEPQLQELLDKRVNLLIKRRYTKDDVSSLDILPSKIGKQTPLEYLVERTLKRPRDLIHFFNLCIENSEGQSLVTGASVKKAESQYSSERLRFLGDEWFSDYPDLLEWTRILRGKNAYFDMDIFREESFNDILLSLVSEKGIDCLHRGARDLYEEKIDSAVFATKLCLVFYRVGLLGIKLSPDEATQWASEGGRKIRDSEVSNASKFHIHRMAWRALGVVTPGNQPT